MAARILNILKLMDVSKKTALVLVANLLSLTAFAGDLYVSPQGSDTAAGTLTAPLRTIQKASSLAVPGTVVHVAPGTYSETIRTTNSGTASARIRFVSDVKWGAKIVPAAGAYTMWNVEGGYIDIDGFQITGAGSSTVRVGIALIGGNSSVRNTWAHHIAENSGCDNKGGAALLAHQARGSAYTNYDFINNLVHNVGGGCGWIQGIYHQSTGNIKNNLIYACSQAVDMGHDAHNINVVNNTFFGNSGYAIYYGGCKEAYNNGCPTSGIKIHNNILFDNYGGVQGPIATEDVGNEVKNNLNFGNRVPYDLATPSKNSRTGEIMADPQFVNYVRTGGGDYHLKSNSPAINRGLATLAVSTDYDGNLRSDGTADIGAFEYGSAPAPAPTPVPEQPVARADMSFSPSSVIFPNQLVGTASAVQLITMKNTGNAVLDLSKSWTITGDFTFGNMGTCGASLAAGATCTVSLKFVPTAVGLRTGRLTILDNTVAGSHSVALSGTGVSALKPVLTVSKTSMLFPTQPVWTSSVPQYVILKNTGNAALMLTSQFAFTGDFKLGSNSTCRINVAYAPGTSCSIAVVFAPKAKGTRTGTLTINSNASSTPVVLRLTGTGI